MASYLIEPPTWEACWLGVSLVGIDQFDVVLLHTALGTASQVGLSHSLALVLIPEELRLTAFVQTLMLDESMEDWVKTVGNVVTSLRILDRSTKKDFCYK